MISLAHFVEVLWELILFTFRTEASRGVLLAFDCFFASSAYLVIFPVVGFDEVLQWLVAIAPRTVALRLWFSLASSFSHSMHFL